MWYQVKTLDSLTRSTGTGLRAVDALLRAGDSASPPPVSEAGAEAVKRTSATVKRAAKAGWESVAQQVDVDIAFNLLDPRVVELLAMRTQSIKSAVVTLDKRIRAEISEGVSNGETIDDLSGRIRDFLRAESVGMAKTVARTEALAPFSLARKDAMQEAGIEKHEWLSARDTVVRDEHQIDGEVRTIGEPFSNGMRWPHDEASPPELSINDRCVTLPVAA